MSDTDWDPNLAVDVPETVQAREVRRGSWVVLSGRPCKVVDVSLTSSCMVGDGESRATDRPLRSRSHTAGHRGGLLVGEQSGDGLDDVAHVLAAAVVPGEGPPVLHMPDAVFDTDAS